MTRKEKKELALKLKEEIKANSPQEQKSRLPSKKNLEENNRRRYAQAKAKTMSGVKRYRKSHNDHWDTDPW